MKFSTYRILYKKAFINNNNLIISIISYTIIYALILLGILFWNKNNTLSLYMYSYISLFSLSLIFSYSEGKGDKLLIEFFKYTPLKPINIYFYHYFQRMWYNPHVHLDITIPAIIFFIFKIPLTEIINFLFKIHILILIILFIQYLILWFIQKNMIKFFFILIIITTFSIYPTLNNWIYPKLKSIFNNSLDLTLTTLLIISITSVNFVIESLLKVTKNKISNSWIKYTNIIINTLTKIIPLTKNTKAILNYSIKMVIRNSNLIYNYLLCICFVLVTRTLWNTFLPKNGYELLSTIALVLSISMFTKIKMNHHLDNTLNLFYFPIPKIKIQLLTDSIGFINILIIWLFLILDFSLTYNFSYKEFTQCTILLICYYIISTGFNLPKKEQNNSKEEEKKYAKQILKITLLFALAQTASSFLITPIIKINLAYSLILIPILILWPYFKIYKKLKPLK
ncbi:hypothetical protein [Bacillus pseudomycoides]|uniref:hypothetical protein n=1 Tax=Bacillus pseudomycoides TaxID=64104 RepID=UPI000BF16917|nr:hypothetical protein [Bacillus pseudomycoides]PEJ33173.1 hypothetical protein CN677_16130 [Bacillus pseudomycoides]PHA95731.1 hypothetical protein COE78_08735 [Bacillus pseudomycoides]PHC74060.1 hypothetical protein COF38_18050 [Bacillus pseudomycoides]